MAARADDLGLEVGLVALRVDRPAAVAARLEVVLAQVPGCRRSLRNGPTMDQSDSAQVLQPSGQSG